MRLVCHVVAIGALLAVTMSAIATDESTGEYAGSAACAPCHEAEHARWAGSSHALAARRVPAESLAARFDGADLRFPSLTFAPIRRGARPAFRLAGPEGSAVVPLALVLGAREIEQFLTPVGHGRFQALSVGFDVERAQWFDIFPEAPRTDAWAHWRNPGATANGQCLECHMTGYEKGYDAAADGYDTRWHEIGVGCEACHGPGAGHVRAREAGRVEAPAYGAVAAPGSTPGCVFCHSRRAVLTDHYDPGADATEQLDLELLDSGLYHPDGQLRGEAYEWVSFQMSRMAGRGVVCQDCHEPHAGTLRASGNDLCLRCHEARLATTAHTHHAADSPGSACVSCHMPEVTFMERDARRDHLLGQPDPALAAAIGAPDACTMCHTDESQAWAAAAVERWYPPTARRDDRRHVAATFAAARDGHVEAAPFLRAIVADAARDPVRRASAARLLGQFITEPDVADSLRGSVSDPLPLVRAAAVRGLTASNDMERATARVLVQAVADPSLIVRLEAAFALRGFDVRSLPEPERIGVEHVSAEWLAAQAVLAELPETNFNRGVFLEARGDAAGAEAAYRTAIRRWPHDLPPRQNLALLLARQGRRPEAVTELDAILAESPGWPPAAFARALQHAEDAEWTVAAGLLEACLAADPAYPRAAYDLGLAYARLGDGARAEQALERATRDPSSRRDALRELVRLAHLRGDRQAEQRWLPEALLADPAVRDEPAVRAALGMPAGGDAERAAAP